MKPELEKNIIAEAIEAVKGTGKKFNDLPKESILKYLKTHGLGTSDSLHIYEKLDQFYNKRGPVVSSLGKDKESIKPRKNIFGEIKRIA